MKIHSIGLSSFDKVPEYGGHRLEVTAFVYIDINDEPILNVGFIYVLNPITLVVKVKEVTTTLPLGVNEEELIDTIEEHFNSL